MQPVVYTKSLQPAIYSKEQALIKPVKPGPCISIIMPFEPKMASKSKLEQNLIKAIENATDQLLQQYPAYTTGLVVKRLKALVASLDYSTHKKTIVLYVSSRIEKALYLDIVVQDKVIVGQSFDIRDIVLNKQLPQEFLLLVLGNEKAKILLGNADQFTQLVTNSSDHMEVFKNDLEESVSNISGPQHRKEVLSKKFIHHIDNGLSIILKAYPLPLFLACSKTTLAKFMQLSINKDHIVEYIQGNYEDATEVQLKALLHAYLEDWQQTKEKYLLIQLENALNKKKCSVGIKNTYKAAARKNGKLLIVEKNYLYPAFGGEANQFNPVDESVLSNSIYLKDPVDDVIEKVLENSGDVAFVSDGLLKDYEHIALIQFY